MAQLPTHSNACALIARRSSERIVDRTCKSILRLRGSIEEQENLAEEQKSRGC